MARIAILTASDKGAAGERVDASGDVIERRLRVSGHDLTARVIVPDDREAIARILAQWSDDRVAEIIVTTGGTGLTARDITPEATRDIAEREVPGIPVALWINGLKKTPFATLSRGIAVTRGETLIVNLPGNPRAVDEGMDVLLQLFEHIATLLRGSVEHTSAADSGHSSEQSGTA